MKRRVILALTERDYDSMLPEELTPLEAAAVLGISEVAMREAFKCTGYEVGDQIPRKIFLDLRKRLERAKYHV